MAFASPVYLHPVNLIHLIRWDTTLTLQVVVSFPGNIALRDDLVLYIMCTYPSRD